MWNYEKRLQYPVRIKQTNPQLAKIIITQYGGAYPKSYVLMYSITKYKPRALSPGFTPFIFLYLINPQH